MALLLRDMVSECLRLPGQGFVPAGLPGVRLFWATEPVARAPLLYEAGIVILAQGHKVGFLDGERFRYDAETYLILSVPMPLECETHASQDNPVLGLVVDIDVVALGELVTVVGESLSPAPGAGETVPRGVEPVPMDASMLGVAERLVSCLRTPLDSRVLGRSRVEEIIYRALMGPHGRALQALTQQHSSYARVARSLSWIHRSYADALSVEHLAQQASMSLSAFHRAFKQVTGESPLQYLKKVRLNKAKSLLVHEGRSVSAAAYEVGYESPSQFSREFKRYFKLSPTEARGVGV